MRKTMNPKTKILLGILVIGIVLIGGLWVWNSQTENINCSNITSADAINKCIGKKVEVIGILECEKPEIPTKAGVHFLKFEDGSEIRFLEEYPDCKEYNLKKVKVTGELYQCRPGDQCAGIGLANIESVILLEEMVKEEEKVKEVLIEHRWGGLGGGSQEWKRIYQKGNGWVVENCEKQGSVQLSKEKGRILCCETETTKEEVEKLLKAVKNTEIPKDVLPPPTDVFSSYEISIRTSQREIWIGSTGQIAAGAWNVISQTSNQRELFQMNGEKILKAISNLPSCEKKKEVEKIEYEISQPVSLLTKFLPLKLEDLVPVQMETFSFPTIRIFDEQAEGIVDSLTMKWVKKETPLDQVLVPDVEISILAFKDKKSFEKFPMLAISIPAGSAPTVQKIAPIKIENIEGYKYIFYSPKPKELMEPFDIGDITLFILAKDNILIRIRGNQNFKNADSTANAELILQNLRLEEKSPSYIWEDQKIQFKGSLHKEEVSPNVENCLKLGRRVEIFMCIDKTAQITGDAKVCDIYKNPEFKDIEPTFIETCYIFAAVGREDPSVCDKLKTYTKERCLGVYNRELAKAKNDPVQCAGNAECLEHFVEITGDLKFCDMISDKFAREWCYRDHAVTVKQCDEIYKIGGPNNPSRDYCIERLAIQSKKVSLCEKINDSYKLGAIIKNRCKRNFEE